MRHLKQIVLGCVLISLLSGCQLRPVAKGLPTLDQLQTQQQLTQQTQMDIRWKDQAFSFLLYQRQYADYLQVLALTVSGQILFEVHYDGEKVKVIQRIDAMKYLPFDYVLRDILWGTLSEDIVKKQTEHLGLNFKQDNGLRVISQKSRPLVNVLIKDQYIEIDNLSVPYQMTMTPSTQDFFEQE